MLDGPVFLAGFMATGKSKVGSILARRLGRTFVDTDQMVEEREGAPVSAIFARHGEEHFRALEHECVRRAAELANAVVALGGGAVTREANVELIRRRGVLVCLEADVETILERVSRRDDRPLLAGLNREQMRAKIEQMLAARAPFYARADIRLRSSEEQSPEETAGQLVELLEEWSARSQRRP